MKSSRLLTTLAVLIALVMPIQGTLQASEAPLELTVALFLQLIVFENNLMGKEGDFSVHIVGSSKLADMLSKKIGWQIGKRKLGKVTESNSMPTEKTDVMCIVKSSNIQEVVDYTHKEKILSFTNNPDFVSKGVALGVGVNSDGKPAISINLKASKEEGLNWNPAILKIAIKVK